MDPLHWDDCEFVNETEDSFRSVVSQDEAVKKIVAVLGTQNRSMLSWFRGRSSEVYSRIRLPSIVEESGVYADAFCSDKITKLIGELPHLHSDYSRLQRLIRGGVISVPVVDSGDLELTVVLNDKLAVTVEKVKKQPGDRSEAVAELEGQIATMLENIRTKLQGMRTEYVDDAGNQTSDDEVSAHMRCEKFEAAASLGSMFTTFRDMKEKLGVAFPEFLSMMSTVLHAVQVGLLGQKAIDNLLAQIEAFVVIVRKLEAPELVVSVCGETSVGKTTLLNGCIGSQCLPTDEDANSACPVRIVADPTQAVPRLVIPPAFMQYLNNAVEAILKSIHSLIGAKVSCSLPHHVAKQYEAEAMYNTIYAAVDGGELFTFHSEVFGAEAISACIGHINGVVRLSYGLQASPRFAFRLHSVHPLGLFLRDGVDVISQLPTIYAVCQCTTTVPFLGVLSFVDTPGISEGADAGSPLMRSLKAIVDKIFAVSHRILLLTTPTTRMQEAFATLCAKARETNFDALMIVINKFDQVHAREGETLQAVMGRYRNEYERDGHKRWNVQFMRAHLLQMVADGRVWIDGLGGVEKLTPHDLLNMPESTRRMINDIYGNSFAKQLGRKKINNDDFEQDCAQAVHNSNFTHVMAIAVLPTFIRQAQDSLREFGVSQQGIKTSTIAALRSRLVLAQKFKQKQRLYGILKNISQQLTVLLSCADLGAGVEKVLVANTEARLRTKIEEHVVEVLLGLKEDVMSKIITATQVNTGQPRRNRKVKVKIDDEEVEEMIDTAVAYKKEEDADTMRKTCIAVANACLAGSGIDARTEAYRKEVFTAELKGMCATLINAFKGSLPEQSQSEGPDEQAAALKSVQESFNSEISTYPGMINLEVEPAPVAVISDGVCVVVTPYWFFWTRKSYVVAYELIQNVFCRRIDEHYGSQAYATKQIERGREYLKEAAKKFAASLESLKGRVDELIDHVQEAVVPEDPAVLESCIKKLTMQTEGGEGKTTAEGAEGVKNAAGSIERAEVGQKGAEDAGSVGVAVIENMMEQLSVV
jgi:hypothetical protein